MSSYCINPLCEQRQNPDDAETCLSCGTPLLINGRIRLLKPLRELTYDPHSYFEVFEVDDAGTRWHPVRERRVMKVLKWNSLKLRKLIEQESLTLQLIRHPCVPRTTLDDFFTFVPNNSLLELRCLVMDKIEGQNLEQWLESNGRISQSVALDWLKQLVEILDVVHHTEFFHRDIKPSNIILQPNEQLALIDFGTARRVTDTYLAKVSGSGGTSSRVGTYEITSVVTPCYTPLEQINGRAVPQSDFYALGCTFVNLVTDISLSDLPTDENTGNLVWRNKAPQIDKPFADFIDELMAFLPGQRPQTTEVILQRLEKLPQQIKKYRLTNSKVFKYSKYALMGLGIVGSVFLSLPLVANYLVAQGQKLETRNDYQNAQNFFNLAITTNPSAKFAISKYYLDKASQLMITGNLKAAKNNYELSVKYNNQNIDAYNLLGITCQQLSDRECIKYVYSRLFQLKPNDWTVHYNLGRYYDEQESYELAEKEYNKAIKSSSSAMIAINNLSRLKIKTGDYNLAISLAQSGLQKNKDPLIQAALYKNLGWASLEQKKISDAEKYLEKALSLDNHRIDAYCLLAKAQEALGKIDEARISVEVCLLAKSTDSDISIFRQELLDRILEK
ncbi:MAG: tetratricopeptide repeat protein [Komarekiella atlantica HA4396-MV6]|jgi:tetratricopeptide (TPR) repeat protein|nr:tetratricopeptide repeat protein [Komarekiella atlantica HA4396-MV6]